MKTHDCDLLSNCGYTSNIKNNSVKRSFSNTNQNNISDDEISCKKKKVDEKNSDEDRNSAVLISNGYMTRNRLKRQLTEKNELKKCVIKDEFTEHSETKNKSGTGKRIRNSLKTIQNNKLKLGYVFTHDIFLKKQLDTQHKKNIPSLFESDSESEIESYHLNDSIKTLDDVKEKPIRTTESECTPAFSKDIEVKTYFNKKTNAVNNISNNISSNIFEEINQIKKSSSFSYQIKDYFSSNECEEISQNENICYDPLKVSEPAMSVEDTINDERIIVTDEFIKELENEIQMDNTFLQDASKTQDLSDEKNAVKSIIPETEHKLNTKADSLESEEISLDFISMSENQKISDDIKNIKSNITNGYHSENEITPHKYEDMSFDFCNASKTQDLSDEKNAVKSIIPETEHKLNTKADSLESEEISLDFISTPTNQENVYDTNNLKLHLNTEIISNKSKVLSIDYNNLNINSKCRCKIFYSFNKDANKILTSKTKHFAFNNNAKKIRQKLFLQKHLEANNLEMLITESKKYITQPEMCLPTNNSIPLKIKYEKCINLKENHIDKPNILNMPEDIYIDRDHLPENNNKSPKLQNNIKINVQASIQKPTDNISKNDISSCTINSRLPVENLVHFGPKIISDNNDVTTNFKLPDENYVHFGQNKIFNNVFESNITANNENLNFEENKTTHHMVSSYNTKNEKIHYENFNESKFTDNITLSCFTKHKHLPDENFINIGENETVDVIVSNITTNNENHYKNCFNFGENKITDIIDSSNTTTNKKPCDENKFSYIKSSSKFSTLSVSKNKKLLSENIVNFAREDFASISTTNTKTHSESHINVDGNRIADNFVKSNISTNKKLCHENLVENETFDKVTIPSFTKNKTLLFENSTDFVKDNKIAHKIFESKLTTDNKTSERQIDFSGNKIANNISSISTSKKLDDESRINFVKDKISDNIFVSKITSTNKKIEDENQISSIKNKISDSNLSSKITSTNKKIDDENQISSIKNKISDSNLSSKITSTNKKIDDENQISSIKNKISDNIVSSKITSANKKIDDENQTSFVKNKISHSNLSSNIISTIKKIDDENQISSIKNKISDINFSSNIISTNKKLGDENQISSIKNKISDNIVSSKITSANKKIDDENQISFVKNKISYSNLSSNIISTNKKLGDENQISSIKNKISDNIVSSKITSANKKIDDENQISFVKNKISYSNLSSKITSANKKLGDENQISFVKNKISDNIVSSKIISTNKKLDDKNQISSIKNKISDSNLSSKITSTNKKIDDENQISSIKNKISDNIVSSKITSTNKKNDDENQNSSIENEISDSNFSSNIISTNKKLDDKNQISFVKNKISDNISLSCITKSKDISDENIYFGKNEIDDNVNVSKITTNNELHTNKHLNSYQNKTSDNVFSKIESTILVNGIGVNFGGKNNINDFDKNISNISKKIKPENVLPHDESFVDFDCAISHSFIKENNFNFDKDCKSSKMNVSFNTNRNIKIEENSIYSENCYLKVETKNLDKEMEIKPLNSSQSNNHTIASFSTENIIPDENHFSKYVSKQPNKSLFDLPDDDIENSLSSCSSDYENRLKIDYEDDFEVNKKSTTVHSLDDESKNSPVTDNLPSVKNGGIEFSEKKLMNSKKKQSIESSVAKNDIDLKPILLKELDSSNMNANESSNISKFKIHSNDCMTKKMCDDLYNKKLLNDNNNKNDYFSKNIQDIFKEMYVDDTFITACQHMIELYDDIHKQSDPKYFQTDNEHINSTHEKKFCDVETQNDVKKTNPELSESIQINPEEFIKFNANYNRQENNKSNDLTNKIQNNSLKQKPNSKSNMKIRLQFREFIKSNKSINEILESKEFRNLRFFKEEEIACSIGTFIFEQTIEPPEIIGLSSYKENCDQLSYEEKNKLLGSVNLIIVCPKIMKLTSITIALVKMLRSDTLIDLILNVIRKNVLNKQMNMYHTIDSQLITQTVYYVDICTRLRLLKNLQTFIFDSMVFIPNKYCCVIFISLLLWKNCLPRYMNNEHDPVIILVMSYLIAKKKFYSEQIAGCDIFQRELINLLSFHFNYQFSTDLPVNFIQHIHKPDFFISVVMFIKCCNPKDLTEFMVNCLFPIIEDYLKTQQNESYALKTMESILIAIKPFKITCNATVAAYLKKYKGSINSSIKDNKEHIYNIIYNNYRAMQNKFIEYLNDYRSCSQAFEESMVSLIMVLGSVDYNTSCVSLMKWKPKFEPSKILFKKIDMFKSIIGNNLWNKLCLEEDTDTIKCLVNSCLLKKDVYTTIVRLHALC